MGVGEFTDWVGRVVSHELQTQRFFSDRRGQATRQQAT